MRQFTCKLLEKSVTHSRAQYTYFETSTKGGGGVLLERASYLIFINQNITNQITLWCCHCCDWQGRKGQISSWSRSDLYPIFGHKPSLSPSMPSYPERVFSTKVRVLHITRPSSREYVGLYSIQICRESTHPPFPPSIPLFLITVSSGLQFALFIHQLPKGLPNAPQLEFVCLRPSLSQSHSEYGLHMYCTSCKHLLIYRLPLFYTNFEYKTELPLFQYIAS